MAGIIDSGHGFTDLDQSIGYVVASLYKFLLFTINSNFYSSTRPIITDSQTDLFAFSSAPQDYSQHTAMSVGPEHYTIGLGPSLSLTAMLNSDDIPEFSTLGIASSNSYNNPLMTGSGMLTIDNSGSSTTDHVSMDNELNVPTIYRQCLSELPIY